jgi:copper chaperone CopZ
MLKKVITTLFIFLFALSAIASNTFGATKKTTIRVTGMTCGSCAYSVEKVLKETEGVKTAVVSYQKGRVQVEYDDEKVTLAKLREAINSTGFKAVEGRRHTSNQRSNKDKQK